MRYRIGSFRKLTGLSEPTLRYYEKMKLLCPARDDGNDYRYYDETDLLRLVQIRQFSGFDIPLSRLPTEEKQVSAGEMMEELTRQRLELENAIETLHQKLARIRLHEQNFSRICGGDRSVQLSQIGGIYRLFLSDPAVASHPETPAIVQRWMSHMPYTHSTLRVSREELLSNFDRPYRMDLGIGMLRRYFNELGESLCEPIEYSPVNTCVHGIVEVQGLESLDRRLLEPFFRFMEEHSLVPIGDLFGWVVYMTGSLSYVSLRVAVG